MRRVYIAGVGAVSAAGWGVAPLRAAVEQGRPLPLTEIPRPGWSKPLLVRTVPAPVPRPAFLAHPRLRRVSPLTHYAAGAVLEALGMASDTVRNGRLGLVCCLQSGTVQYALRFFEETVRDPATASPLLFPETVFAAPASHIAALLGRPLLVHTFMGDPGAFLQALAIGAGWVAEGRTDGCVVVGTEEHNWLHADAVCQFDHRSILSVGAGAVLLAAEPSAAGAVTLDQITDAHSYTSATDQRQAAVAMRAQLPPGTPSELLCDGLGGAFRLHAAEAAAWRDWPGPRLSLKPVLGEGFMAGAGWQCVLAADALMTGRCAAAQVSVVGCNQQAIGARLVRG